MRTIQLLMSIIYKQKNGQLYESHQHMKHLIYMSIFQMPGKSPCGRTNSFSSHTVCRAMKLSKNGQVDVVIPTFDIENNSSCTAVFKWPEKSWHRVVSDKRKTPLGGALASFNRDTRLIYAGGFENGNQSSNLIYEYEGLDQGWRLWHTKAPMPFADAPFIGVGVDFCQHSIDLKKMTELDPDGELQPGATPIDVPRYLLTI